MTIFEKTSFGDTIKIMKIKSQLNHVYIFFMQIVLFTLCEMENVDIRFDFVYN